MLYGHRTILPGTVGGAVRQYISTVCVYEVVSFLHVYSVTTKRNGLKITDDAAVEVKYGYRRYLFIIPMRTLKITYESC